MPRKHSARLCFDAPSVCEVVNVPHILLMSRSFTSPPVMRDCGPKFCFSLCATLIPRAPLIPQLLKKLSVRSVEERKALGGSEVRGSG